VRRLNIEGRNLEAELDAAVPKLQGLTHDPVAGVGCAALTDHLRAVAWPSKFQPHLPEKYDRSTNPSDGKLLPCSFDRASPDMAHEPHSRVHPILG
jgi:hypothetical protein